METNSRTQWRWVSAERGKDFWWIRDMRTRWDSKLKPRAANILVMQGGDKTCWDGRRPRVAVFNERDAGNAFTWRKNQLSDVFLLGDSSATNPGCQWRWCWGRRSRTTECCWQCWSELPSRVPWIDFRTYLKLSNTHSTYVWMTFFCSIALCCRVGTQLSFYLRWDGKETWRACQGLMTLSTWKREEAGKAFRVIYRVVYLTGPPLKITSLSR